MSENDSQNLKEAISELKQAFSAYWKARNERETVESDSENRPRLSKETIDSIDASFQSLNRSLTQLLPQISQAVNVFGPFISSLKNLSLVIRPGATGESPASFTSLARSVLPAERAAGATTAGGSSASLTSLARSVLPAEGTAGATTAGGSYLAKANPYAAAIAAIATVTVEFVRLGPAIKEFATRVLESNRQFADYSAAMAGVFADAEVQNAFRNMRVGNRLSDSAAFLNQAQQSLANSTEDFEIIGKKIANYGAGLLAYVGKGITELIKIAVPIHEINRIIERNFGSDHKPISLGEWAAEVEKDASKSLDAAKKRMDRAKPGDYRNPRGNQGPGATF